MLKEFSRHCKTIIAIIIIVMVYMSIIMIRKPIYANYECSKHTDRYIEIYDYSISESEAQNCDIRGLISCNGRMYVDNNLFYCESK